MFDMKSIQSNSDLLKTNSLTLEKIIERIDQIKSLLENEEVEFTKKEEEKLKKLIEKTDYLKKIAQNKIRNDKNDLESLLIESQRLIEEISIDENIEDQIKEKSEKYFPIESLSQIAKNTKEEFGGEVGDLDLKIREPRTAIRLTQDSEIIKEIVYLKTKIIKIDQDNFTLQYPESEMGDKDSIKGGEDNFTNFLFSIKFRNDKAEFIFEKIFKENDLTKMTPQDHLFPEEIQIEMFKKLINNNPEVLEKIKSARKINCIQSTIINRETLLRISNYLELRTQNPDDLESKKYLSSSPNQSNTQNFMNQLQHVFGIEISNSNPPKVLCVTQKSSSLKQTFNSR